MCKALEAFWQSISVQNVSGRTINSKWRLNHMTYEVVMIAFFLPLVNAHLHVKFQVSKCILKILPMLKFSESKISIFEAL